MDGAVHEHPLVWRTDRAGKLVFVSHAEDVGECPWPWSGATGSRLVDIFDSDRGGFVGRRVLEELLVSSQSFGHLRVRVPRADRDTWVLEGAPVQTADGGFDGFEGKASFERLPEYATGSARSCQAQVRNRQTIEVLEAVYGAVGIYDLDGTLTFVSRVTLETSGVELEEVVGKPISATFWWSEDPGNRTAMSEAIVRAAAGERSHFDARIRVRNPETHEDDFIWIRTTVAPLRDENGAVTEVLGFATDITAERQASDAALASEARFRHIAETAPVPIVISRRSTGEILFRNDSAVRLCRGQLGIDIDSDPTFNFWQRPGDRIAFLAKLEAEGRVEGYEVGLKTQGGEPYWTLINARLLEWQGEYCLLICFLDIDERRRAEVAVRHSEARLSGVLEIAPDAVIVADKNQRITLFNKGARMIFGYEEDEALGQPIDILVPPAFREGHSRMVDSFVAGNEDSREMGARSGISGIRKSGEIFPAEASISRFFVDGEPILTILLHDATERRRREAELESARQQAEEANRAKSLFVAHMSHEIRTPMNGVLGMADALALTDLTEDQQEMLSLIRRSGGSLLTVLNDVLDVSKIESGAVILEETPLSLRVLGKRAIELQSAVAKSKGLVLSFYVDESLDGHRLGDAHRLSQILNNLLSNAIKFTEKGSVTLDIVPSSEWPGAILFRVIDTGIGMSPEHAKHVFSPFVQADASTTRRFGGTGLGLSIVKGLCECMRGNVRIKSTPGEGSTVEVILPLERAEGPDAPAQRPERRTDGRTKLRRRILAAEDNALNRRVLEKMLARSGAEITFAEDGAEALDRFRRGAFDLVLMDIQMPVMDGLEALAAIRAFELGAHRPATPVYALTANAMKEQVAEYKTAGFDGLLTKPIQIADLLAVVMGGPVEQKSPTSEGAVKAAPMA